MDRDFYCESVWKQILEIYIKPLEKMIDRRAKYYLYLCEKDMFGMGDEEAKKHNDKMQEVGEEVEALAKVISAINGLHLIFNESFERLESKLKRTQDIAYQLSLDLITIRQTLQVSSDWETFLLGKIISMDQLVYTKIPSNITLQHA